MEKKAVFNMEQIIIKTPRVNRGCGTWMVYEKYQLSLTEMKYMTYLMNLNGLPFPLKGMDDKV